MSIRMAASGTVLLGVACAAWCAPNPAKSDAATKGGERRYVIGVETRRGMRFGYIDGQGRVVIKPQFAKAREFSDALAAVKVFVKRPYRKSPEERWAYIDPTGSVAIGPLDCDNLTDFSEGRAFLLHGRAGWALIDSEGNLLTEPVYWHVEPFSEGLAYAKAAGGKEYGYIDRFGAWVIRGRAWAIRGRWGEPYSDGLARISGGTNIYRFIDKTGNIAVHANYHDARSFSEGLAAVTIDGEKWGFIDKAGKMVIKPKWSKAYSFSHGLALVRLDPDHVGYIDKSGEVVIEKNLTDGTNFVDGLACVSTWITAGEKWGFIDTSGEWAIPPRYEKPAVFRDGLAYIREARIYIDKTGKTVWSSR